MLFPCIAGVNLTQSFSEVFSFISFKDLFLEIRPVKFTVRLAINGDNDPFEDFIGFRFSVFDVDFGKDVSVDFGSDLDSFFPLTKVLFFVGFDLFFILVFFIVIFKIAFIEFDLSVEIVNFSFQISNGFGAL